MIEYFRKVEICGYLILVAGISAIHSQTINFSGPQISYSYDDKTSPHTTVICSKPTTTGTTQIANVFQNSNPGFTSSAFCLDASLCAFKNGTNLNFLNSQSWGTDIYSGTPSDPCNTRIIDEYFKDVIADPSTLNTAWINANDFVSTRKFGYALYPSFNPFVMAMYKCSQFSSANYTAGQNDYLGIIHVERYTTAYIADPSKDQRVYTIGIAYSTNSGQNWTYCGDIIKPQAQFMDRVNGPASAPYLFNIHGGAYIINKTNDSIYVFFNESPNGCTNSNNGYLSVAAAKLETVLLDAQNSTVTQNSWQKYNNGVWNSGAASSNAFNGVGSSILPNSPAGQNFHNKATYCKSINKYLILVEGWLTNDFGPSLIMYASNDGLNWNKSWKIDYAPWTNSGIKDWGVISYANFSALPTDQDAAPDFHVVGKEFYINYQKLLNQTINKPSIYQGNIYYQKIVAIPDITPALNLLLGDEDTAP